MSDRFQATSSAWRRSPSGRNRALRRCLRNLTVAGGGPFPRPRFAVSSSFTLRVNETATELPFVPRSAVRCSRRTRSTPPAARHARSRAAGRLSAGGVHTPKKWTSRNVVPAAEAKTAAP
jgi:hypothetical protein